MFHGLVESKIIAKNVKQVISALLLIIRYVRVTSLPLVNKTEVFRRIQCHALILVNVMSPTRLLILLELLLDTIIYHVSDFWWKLKRLRFLDPIFFVDEVLPIEYMLDVTFLTFRHFLEKLIVFLLCSKDFIVVLNQRFTRLIVLLLLVKGWLGMIQSPVIGLPHFCLSLCLDRLLQFWQRRVIEGAKLLLSIFGLLPHRAELVSEL